MPTVQRLGLGLGITTLFVVSGVIAWSVRRMRRSRHGFGTQSSGTAVYHLSPAFGCENNVRLDGFQAGAPASQPSVAWETRH